MADGGQNQIGDEEIDGLEAVKANALVVTELLRCQKNDGRNDAEHWDVAQDGRVAFADAAEKISARWTETGTRLGLAALRTV